MGAVLWLPIPRQELIVFLPGQVPEVYRVSTSLYGTGSTEGSQRTPVGKFRLAEKIGEGMPVGTIFKARKPVGIWSPDTPMLEEPDLILTRIIWLDGIEPHNANTHQRYIYIHGTNHEALIGTPASHGCVRMRNADVMELFEKTGTGDPLWITTAPEMPGEACRMVSQLQQAEPNPAMGGKSAVFKQRAQTAENRPLPGLGSPVGAGRGENAVG